MKLQLSESTFLGLIGAACVGLVILFPCVLFVVDILTKPWTTWMVANGVSLLPIALAPFILFFMVKACWKKFVGHQEPTTRELITVAVSALIVSVIMYVVLQIAAGAASDAIRGLGEFRGSADTYEATGSFGITAAAVLCFLGMPNAALISAFYGWFWRGPLIRHGIIRGAA